eukprot:6160610-Prymnesium_polylepis.1
MMLHARGRQLSLHVDIRPCRGLHPSCDTTGAVTVRCLPRPVRRAGGQLAAEQERREVRRERLPLQQKQGPSRKDRNHMHTARTSINSLSQWSVTLRPAISMPMDNISVESMAAKTDITKYCRGSRRRACTKPN